MTASSISQCANDPQLQERVLATAQKELVYNEELRNTQYGKQLLAYTPGPSPAVPNYSIVMPLMWPLASDQEETYLNCLLTGRRACGHDSDVISDEAILSAVKTFWPKDPEPVVPAPLPPGPPA